MTVFQRKLFRDLRDLKAQVLTLATLVICGVAVMVSSWSAYQSLEVAKGKYYESFNFADVFVDFEKAPSDVIDRFKRIKGMDVVEGRIVEDALMEAPNQAEPAIGRFVSWSPQSLLNKVYLREGRLPELASVPEVMVHESFAKAHHLHVGDHLTVFFRGQKTRVQISGIGISPEYVYALSPIAMLPDDKHFGVFWMAHGVLEQLTQMQGSFNNIVGAISADVQVGTIKLEMDQIIKPYGSLGAYDRSKQISHLFVEDEIRQQKSMATIIPGIFLAVGAFILNVVMNRLISLHRGQISILKALGYSSSELAIYYFKLISVILLLGVLPAFFLAQGIGHWYASLYEQFFRFPEISFSLTRESLVMGLAAGLIPGWLSSIRTLVRVFKLPPSEGMRPPSPPSFHKGILEKMGLLRARGIFTRMIFRDLFFHPLRSLAAIVGIAAATAIMVNGSFWLDIVNFMIKRQFQEMSREDLEIRFIVPRKLDVLNELKRIPGIQFIEGARTVPVRMHLRNISKETALIALSESSSLRRILDKEGRVLSAPEEGVLMSVFFQKRYGLQVGEILRFEVLQGKQPHLSLPIAGFVDDVLGASVYLQSKQLHRLLQEEAVIDAAYLRVDSKLREKVYIKLKESPVVAAINLKDLLIRGFQETLAEMIYIFTLILISFAVAISGAVLFNISRISLSEKSWELASLRILGFDVGVVFNLLFVQLGIQVLAAAFPGLLLGYGISFLSTYWIHSETFIFPLVVEVRTYALAILIIFLTYLLGGRFLYKKVESLSMSEALKARE